MWMYLVRIHKYTHSHHLDIFHIMQTCNIIQSIHSSYVRKNVVIAIYVIVLQSYLGKHPYKSIAVTCIGNEAMLVHINSVLKY